MEGRGWGSGVGEERGGWGLGMSIVVVLMPGEGRVEVLGGGDKVARRRNMGLGRMAWGFMGLRALMKRSMGGDWGSGAGVGEVEDVGEESTVVCGGKMSGPAVCCA